MSTSLLDTARWYHSLGASVNAIRRNDKSPLNKWKHLHEQPQPSEELESYPWAAAGGIGINNGPGDFHTFDIDAIKDQDIARVVSDGTIDMLLDLLHLPRDYPWVWRGRSKAGWAVSFRCADPLPTGTLPVKKTEAGVAWGWPEKDSGADWHHLELRWARCQTIYPPSQGYQWRHEPPTEAPALVPVHRVIAAFFTLCPAQPHTISSLERGVIDQIRQRFDLVAYAQQHLGGELHSERDGEVRLLGHGGMLINPTKGIWNCFQGEIGGDAIDLVAYARYGTDARNLNGKSPAVIAEAAQFAGVTLPDRKPTDTVDIGTDTPATDTQDWQLRPRFIVRDLQALDAVEPPRWTLQNEAIERGYHLIYGASGGGKTFYAIDRALRLAAAGHRTLYIATEDLAGLKIRVRAWRNAHPTVDTSTFTWLEMPEGIDLLNQQQVDELLATLTPYGFTHITLDTLRESYTGDENSSQDGSAINRVVQALVRMGASVDVVHHSGVEDKRPRGTTAIFANADMVIRVGFDGEYVTVRTDKVRNSQAPDDRRYVLVPTATGLTATDNTPIVSAILRSAELAPRQAATLTRSHKAILEMLAYSIFADTGAKTNQIIDVTGLSSRTVFRTLSDLKDRGFITQSVKGDPYTITPAGRAQLEPDLTPVPPTSTTPTATHDTASECPTATTAKSLPPTVSQFSDTQLSLPATATTLKSGSGRQLESVAELSVTVADHPPEIAAALEWIAGLPVAARLRLSKQVQEPEQLRYSIPDEIDPRVIVEAWQIFIQPKLKQEGSP